MRGRAELERSENGKDCRLICGRSALRWGLMENPGPSAAESRESRLPSDAAALISPKPSIACLAAAASAAVLVLLWQSLTVHYNYSGNWTALFRTGDTYTVPPSLFPGTYIFSETDGYDGMWYRYIAHDPLSRRGLAEFIDVAGIRYRRILVPGLAHLLGTGRPEWIDGAYIAVVWVFVALGVYWCSRYFRLHGRGPAWRLLFLLVPATLTSIDRMVVDGPLTALFAGFLFYAETSSWRKAYLIALLAFLTRETGILLIAGLVMHSVLKKQYRRAILSSTAALPTFAWYAFVWRHAKPGALPDVFAWPLLGIVRRMFTVREFAGPVWKELIFQTVDLLSVLGLLLSIILALWWIAKQPLNPVGITVGLFCGLGLVLGSPYYLREAYGFARAVSPLLLFVLLAGVRKRAWPALLAPLSMTLSVGLFFVTPAWRILMALPR